MEVRWVELAHLAQLGRKRADKRGMETEGGNGYICVYVPDILHKEMCIESILRAGMLLKWEFFSPHKRYYVAVKPWLKSGPDTEWS